MHVLPSQPGGPGTVNEMTEAFRLNLTALSLLALVVGVFLIYNTVTFSVIQRRPVLGSLRALGMTRREIFTTILVEAGMHGAVGTLAGLALGVFLGRGAVQMVTQTMNDLFFVVAVREVSDPAGHAGQGRPHRHSGCAGGCGDSRLGGDQRAAGRGAETQ
jgi:hypothetical protein